MQLGRTAEESLKLRMRQERPELLQGTGPAQLVDGAALVPGQLQPGHRAVQIRSCRPAASRLRLPDAFNYELGPYLDGVPGVLAAPAAPKDCWRWLRPPHHAAGQQNLQAFGETGLPAAISADNQRQARSGRHFERRRRPDPAKTTHGKRREIRADRRHARLSAASRPALETTTKLR